MSDQTPTLSSLGAVDGRNLINVPGGGGGIASINGDATAAQTLTAGTAISITDNGLGDHTFDVSNIVTAVESDGSPSSSGATFVHFTPAFDGVVAPPGFVITTVPGGMTVVTFNLLSFAPGNKGIVSDPGAAAAADYLGADNTFRPLPLSAVQIAQSVSAGDTIPTATPTAICPVTVPATGFFQVSANVKFATIPPATPSLYSIVIQDDFAVSVVASQFLEFSGAGAGSLQPELNCSTAVQASAGIGHTFSIIVTQISGVSLVTSADLLTSLTMLFLSA